jgi:hypothetical protein
MGSGTAEKETSIRRTGWDENLGGFGQIVVQAVDAGSGHLVVAERIQLLDVAVCAGHPDAHRLADDAKQATQGARPFGLWEP